jgi:hypothetical protein
VLEEAEALSPAPVWTASTNAVTLTAGQWSAWVNPFAEIRFYRLRQVQ